MIQILETDIYYRRQILTSKVDHRAVRVNPYTTNHVYSFLIRF